MIALSIFAIVFTVYYNSYIIYAGNDSRWTIPVAMSIIKEGNIDLDEYQANPDMHTWWYLHEDINGHLYNRTPLGASIIAVPFVFLLDWFLKICSQFDLAKYLLGNSPVRIEVFVVSSILALTAVMLYLFIKNISARKKATPLIIVFIFAFCTSNWSVVSRYLWQHGPSE